MNSNITIIQDGKNASHWLSYEKKQPCKPW